MPLGTLYKEEIIPRTQSNNIEKQLQILLNGGYPIICVNDFSRFSLGHPVDIKDGKLI